MPDNIWREKFWERNNAGEDNFAWHHLGKRGTPGVKVLVKEALIEIGGEYVVQTVPLWYNSPADGLPVMSDRVAIVRPAFKGEPEAVYGVATKDYTPLQNGDLAEMLEPLAEQWPLETIGLIKQGADLFLTLDAGRIKVANDEIRQFFFCWQSHDGSSAFKIRNTPVRVVCQNTCIMGDEASTIALDVRHTPRVKEQAEFAMGLVAKMRMALDRTEEALNILPGIRLTMDDVKAIFEAAYPIRPPSKLLRQLQVAEKELNDEQAVKLQVLQASYDTERATMAQRKLLAFQRLLAFNESFKRYANTGWAAYNAITEVETWRRGGSEEQNAQSILFGERGDTMARGYNRIVAVAR